MAHLMQRPAQVLTRHSRGVPALLSCAKASCTHVKSCHSSQAPVQEGRVPGPHTDQQQQQQQQLPQQQQLVQQQQQQPEQSSQGGSDALVDDWCQRSRLLVGADGLQKLAAVNVLLVGLGGVGSFAAEFLCRAGVGRMTLVDGDSVDTTNRNRQLPALSSTVGQLKTQVVAQRLMDINPDLQLTVHQEFLDPVRAAALVQEQDYSYVIDCIDSVAPKVALLLAGHTAGVATISSMGAGGRMDPSRVRLADISETHNDAFAAVVRKRLRKAGVASGVTVVFSDEAARPASLALTEQQYKRSYFGTSSYIPGLFGLYIASHVIRQVVEPGYQLPKPAASTTNSPRKSRRDAGSSKKGTKKGSTASSGSTGDAKSTTSSSSTVSSSGSVSDGSSACVSSYESSSTGLASSCAGSFVAHGQQQAGNSLITTNSSSHATPALKDPATVPGSEAKALDQRVFFKSYECVEGVGMGFDGEGL